MEALVKVENNQIVTDSRSVAEHFGKQHKNVLQSIENLAAENPATKFLFHKTTYVSEQNGHSYPMYLMNRDGFSLLVMGFTGAKALERKLEYIQAFNTCVQHKTEDSQLYPKATEKGDRNTTNIKIFENPEFGKVRTTVIDGEPWFVAADVCRALEIGNPRQAMTRLDNDEKNTVTLNDGIKGNPNKTVVNEPGLYSLVLGSRKPEAKAFKRWITHEVIPSIRKNGGYIAGQDTLSDNELMARALLLARRVIDDKTKQITEMKPKADFYDTVANTESLFSMADVAKTLDMGIGRNKLFAFLRDKGILDKDNRPYQKYVDAGYLRLIENHCKAGDNDVVYKCTYVKQRGIDYIRKILLKERGLNESMG